MILYRHAQLLTHGLFSVLLSSESDQPYYDPFIYTQCSLWCMAGKFNCYALSLLCCRNHLSLLVACSFSPLFSFLCKKNYNFTLPSFLWRQIKCLVVVNTSKFHLSVLCHLIFYLKFIWLTKLLTRENKVHDYLWTALQLLFGCRNLTTTTYLWLRLNHLWLIFISSKPV